MDRFYTQTAIAEFRRDALAIGQPVTDGRPPQQSSTGDPQDPPFSRLPIAPRAECQSKTPRSNFSPKNSNYEIVPVAFSNRYNRPANSLLQYSYTDGPRIEQSQATNENLGAYSRNPTNEGVRLKYYGAYLKPAERRGPLIFTRQHNPLYEDFPPACCTSNAPINPTPSGGRQHGVSGPLPDYPSTARLSSHSLTYSSPSSSDLQSDDPSSPIVESPSTTVSLGEVSTDSKDGSDESENETCIFEDANSTLSYDCSILSQVNGPKKRSDDTSSLHTPSTPSSTASFNHAILRVASQGVIQQTAIDQPSRQHSQTFRSEPEELAGPVSDRLIAECDEPYYSPQPRVVRRPRPGSLEIEIPGRYVSIYEDSSTEGPEDLPDSNSDIGEGPHSDTHDSNIHDGSMATPGSFLIDLLNQWEKVPTTSDVPLQFVKQLKHAIDVFENCKADGADDTPSELVDEVLPTWTSSSDSHEAPDSHQSSSSGPYAPSSRSSHSHEIPNLSNHWTPFSERSRIPASRQLGNNTKLQIQHHRAWLSSTPPLELGGKRTKPPNGESDDYCSTAVNDSSCRKKNLHVFFGSKVVNDKKVACKAEPLDLQLSKSWRRSHGKMSIAAELTRTVRGGFKSLKLPALQDHKYELGPAHGSQTDLTLSDCERPSIRNIPGDFPDRAGRRSLSCGPLGRSHPVHQLVEPPAPPASHSSPKKALRVRFQEA
ncbi:hypothetical protein PTTG_08376 [Puccinia triticina 1-1 BBBD Race 1]|uniref:Uncharacterized protein n=1 Tax=Puccinia triticina (isolate 1-1 / race 1 (BBBD)) TaxID=630390 RepID=A0A180GMM2_PUCT1|nr:hypothetical protein PTTG_08376 [Puccinia triticina 1-1 BBBD Race 1]